MAAPAARAAPIGVIGVGNMGLAMAQRLLDRGHRVVVRDITPQAEARVRWPPAPRRRPTVRRWPQRCELLIVAVVDAAQCDAALFGDRGAHAGLHAHSTVMVCSTIGPRDVESIAARLGALERALHRRADVRRPRARARRHDELDGGVRRRRVRVP